MSVVDWNDVTTRGPQAGAVPAPHTPPPRRSGAGDRALWIRIAIAALLATIAHATLFLGLLTDGAAGSHRAYLVALPVLLALGASGYRTKPRGVGDDETDWIVTLLVCGAALTGIHLVIDRLPALSGLWRIEMFAVVAWFAAMIALLFGLRHAVRMWQLWLYAAVIATPLPFLLTSAALGGSVIVTVLLASAVGAAAVALSGRCSPWRLRIAATAGSFAVAGAASAAVVTHAGVLVASALAAGLIPALATMILNTVVRQRSSRLPGSATDEMPTTPRRAIGAQVLLAAAAVVSILMQPHTDSAPRAGSATPGWTDTIAVRPTTTYTFITRYLGSGSRFERFTVPATDSAPAAAVDVITTPDAASLDDLADMVWYPTSRPIDHRLTDAANLPAGTRALHTDADSATTGANRQWYALTWTWSVGSVHQQVTVVVNQIAGQLPPEPVAPTLLDLAVRPALWLARQQPENAGDVGELVTRRAADIAARAQGGSAPTAGGSGDA